MKTSLRKILLSWWGIWIFGLYFIFIQIISRHPSFVERYYSSGIYPYIAMTLRYFLGKIPFSIGDVLYVFLPVSGLFLLVKKIKTLWKKPLIILRFMTKVITVSYVLFCSLWGLNYYREPLHEQLGLDSDYETTDLIRLTEKLILRTNALHKTLSANDTLAVIIPYSKATVFEKASEGYEYLKRRFDFANYQNPSIKKSLHSFVLTYMGYSGYINPFTNEAQVNGMIASTYLPVTACHEQAHQLGFAAENEANFIGFLAAANHPDLYMKYAAYSFVLRYCLYDLRKRNPKSFKAHYETIRLGVIKGYREQNEFWSKYENPAEPIIKFAYNSYLKANHQKKGIRSYNYVVALLVNYYEKTAL